MNGPTVLRLAMAIAVILACVRPASAGNGDDVDPGHPTVVIHRSCGRVVDVWKVDRPGPEMGWDAVTHVFGFYSADGAWVTVSGDIVVRQFDVGDPDRPDSAWFGYTEYHQGMPGR